MQSYKKVFSKVFGGFLILYVVVMSAFTVTKQLDVRREYRNYVYHVLDNLEENLKHIVDQSEDEETLIKDLNMTLTNKLQFSEEFQVYGVAGVARHSEYIAQSGYYMDNLGMDLNFNRLPEGEKYIDLESLFSNEELIEFIKPFEQMTIENEEKEVISRIKVKGYSEGSKVLPETIKYYTIAKRPGENAWYDKNEVLRKTYKFKVKKQEDFTPYQSDFWRFQDITYGPDVEKYRLDLKRVERLQTLKEQMHNYHHKVGWDWQEGFWKMNYSTHQMIETSKGFYGLTLVMVYEPILIALKDLLPVYSFSLIAVLIMSFILAKGLWKTYKKQQQLEKSRRDLVDAVAHELKTPLGIIQAYSEGLKEKIAEEKKDKYLEVIIDETNHMNQLVLEMLDLSKLENNVYKLKLETFSLAVLFEKVLIYYKPLLEEKEIKLIFNPKDFKEIKADYRCMEKVVSNLLSNAIEHTPKKHKIQITSQNKQVIIENEGRCIEEEALPYIWDAFYKGHLVNQRSGRASGLGLYIVKQILELHHINYGIINVEKGVRFWFEP